ncbi:pre-mRNA-splicing factor related, putative [Babesia ovis]|uniref:Pre-mRNA-splicing factor related, putative n=1 Tax=Babesia ovis TaxID=5869 RepID=A0A9W5T7H5_BABOV|nr:pre-mRNA-splicing factor related, putative [Babesia ovis]
MKGNNRRKSGLNIEDNDDFGFVSRRGGNQLDFGGGEELPPLEESDTDEGPVVVNAHEFIPRSPLVREERKRSLTPPRRTVEVDDDDVVYRDKSGKRITREQWLVLHEKRGAKPKTAEPAQELAWGKGLVQKQDHEARALEEQKIAQQPLNRYDIDEEYDQQLKERNRWNDPMLGTAASNEDDDIPKCRFTGVPNRFDIQPGYRWDGVIRGNGYEERWFKARAQKAAKEQQYYLNNIADM